MFEVYRSLEEIGQKQPALVFYRKSKRKIPDLGKAMPNIVYRISFLM
jgi:hypothetical protein